MMEKPIVTVGVFTYNSSKYVIETLESIKAQTYQPLKLIIGDDCSTDNTVELCCKWVEENKSRFISTRIIVPEHNTGVSGNCNRVEDACDTEWYKGIAGDDILMPDCIDNYMEYVSEHSEASIVFGKVKLFLSPDINSEIHEWHNYSFFSLSSEEQYKSLILIGNQLPAPSAFYNMDKMRSMGIKNDERIPLLEDYPKWINITRAGIKMQLLDKYTVYYRMHSDSLSTQSPYSPIFYKSNLLLYLYYYQNLPFTMTEDEVFQMIADKETQFYKKTYSQWLQYKDAYEVAINSSSYRLGHFILKPFLFFRNVIQKIKSKA